MRKHDDRLEELRKCGTVCATGASCNNGHCICPGVLGLVCGGKCVDAESDANNCGKCGSVCTGKPCVNGQCGCPTGTSFCIGSCVDFTTDVKNCGGCGFF